MTRIIVWAYFPSSVVGQLCVHGDVAVLAMVAVHIIAAPCELLSSSHSACACDSQW
jgi:hypothetical protein